MRGWGRNWSRLRFEVIRNKQDCTSRLSCITTRNDNVTAVGLHRNVPWICRSNKTSKLRVTRLCEGSDMNVLPIFHEHTWMSKTLGTIKHMYALQLKLIQSQTNRFFLFLYTTFNIQNVLICTHFYTSLSYLSVIRNLPWWRNQMETFSALLPLCAGNSPVTGESPSQRPVTQSFDVFFDLRRNNRLSKQSRRRWFQTPSLSLLRHCNNCALNA